MAQLRDGRLTFTGKIFLSEDAFNPNVDRQPVASSRTADGAPVADGGNAEPARMAPAYRPRPTFGERVRAFFSGREPAGY